MIVIARKKEGLYGIYVFSAVLSCVMMALGIFYFKVAWYLGLILLGGDGVLVCISIQYCRKIKATPDEIIFYDGVNLICPDGKFPVREITNVTFKCARGGKSYMVYKWGKLTVWFGGIAHNYEFVADVEQVQNSIMNLRLQAENGVLQN